LQPVEVVYAFALPREATLRRFRISGDGFDVASELRSREEARQTYEDGITEGSLSSLASIYRNGLTNLSVGNIRPKEKVVVLLEILAGIELHDDGLRFRFPLTLAPSLAITPMHGSSKLSRDLAK
jgi:Ca-activated chloride channel homolog